MNDRRINTLIFSGLFAALCCGATMFIKFPTAIGYVNAGDAVVLLGAFLLGPVWGAVAAGLGSALADVLAGYVMYAPGTLVIKFLMALLAGLLLRTLALRKPNPAAVLSGAIAEALMVVCYFLYECFILGYGAAALGSVPFNIIQGVFGTAAGAALFGALCKTPYFQKMASDNTKKR